MKLETQSVSFSVKTPTIIIVVPLSGSFFSGMKKIRTGEGS